MTTFRSNAELISIWLVFIFWLWLISRIIVSHSPHRFTLAPWQRRCHNLCGWMSVFAHQPTRRRRHRAGIFEHYSNFNNDYFLKWWWIWWWRSELIHRHRDTKIEMETRKRSEWRKKSQKESSQNKKAFSMKNSDEPNSQEKKRLQK